ncbi:hypothetical protein SSX86_028636 [Deinandra increscens subsp. villosa]|uniref:Uncharacterized protein n=1 Tax=Deinandra increscens subsp. villosa TaxID=3103831 RepID=A0AAP0CB51_9ASTR
MRPPVTETDDHEHYIKLPPTVAGRTSGRRNRDLRQRKRVVAPGKYARQLSELSKSENPVQKGFGSPKAPKITGPVSEPEPHTLKSCSDEEVPVCLNDKTRKSKLESNSGGYMIMVSSLFFTMFFGKLVGIVGTLILVCSLCSHRKNDVPVSENMVVKWSEKGSPEENKKRVIMAGLLERKNHYR